MIKDAYERLIDPRLGLIRRLVRLPTPRDMPAGYHAYRAELAETGRIGAWQADSHAFGAALYNEQAAWRAAIGEAVERYCGNLVPHGLRRASYAELIRAGVPAIDPATLALYSPAQYATRGFPFVPFSPDLPVRWAEGYDLVTGAAVLVPAALVWVTYFRGTPTGDEPCTNAIIYAGIAAGPSREEAERAALEEVFERDAITLAWLRGAHFRRVRLSAQLQALFAGPQAALETNAYAVPNEFGLSIITTLVRDRVSGIVAMGAACRSDPLAALFKAFAETAQAHIVAYHLDDPNSSLMQQARQMPDSLLKPWRQDRSYRQDYRTDWRDVRDFACQLQLYLDPTMQDLLYARLAGSDQESIDLRSLDAGCSSRTDLIRCLQQHGFQAVAVDVTTADVRAAGLHVVRVIVPGLYSNAPEAYPFLGGSRLYVTPAGTLAPEDLCLMPVPLG